MIDEVAPPARTAVSLVRLQHGFAQVVERLRSRLSYESALDRFKRLIAEATEAER